MGLGLSRTKSRMSVVSRVTRGYTRSGNAGERIRRRRRARDRERSKSRSASDGEGHAGFPQTGGSDSEDGRTRQQTLFTLLTPIALLDPVATPASDIPPTPDTMRHHHHHRTKRSGSISTFRRRFSRSSSIAFSPVISPAAALPPPLLVLPFQAPPSSSKTFVSTSLLPAIDRLRTLGREKRQLDAASGELAVSPRPLEPPPPPLPSANWRWALRQQARPMTATPPPH